MTDIVERIKDAENATHALFNHIFQDAREEIERLRAEIVTMERPSAEWFNWLPPGTTHISKIRSVTIPCFGFEARFNAFKYVDGVLYTYRTDSDNEYGEWVKADSRYRDGVLPTVYPLSGAKGEEK